MQEHKYSIKNWAKDDQPREKLLVNGPESLSNSELLAILIHNGNRGQSAVGLSRQILKLAKDNLMELGKLSVKELTRLNGVGKVKAVTIAAAMELGRRRQESDPIDKLYISSSKEIMRYLQVRLKDYRHEVFAVLFLNRANKVNHFEIISEGGITGTVADPRIIFRKALEQDAVGIVLCHNHPSGSLKPSRMDEALTAKIKKAAQLLDIVVIDHVIVSDSGYYSFADNGDL